MNANRRSQWLDRDASPPLSTPRARQPAKQASIAALSCWAPTALPVGPTHKTNCQLNASRDNLLGC